MRVLFDQGTPVPLRHCLSGHQVETVFERNWSRLANGDLLEAAEADGFDVFVTTDQNLKYQQNLSARSIAIIVVNRLRGGESSSASVKSSRPSMQQLRGTTSRSMFPEP